MKNYRRKNNIRKTLYSKPVIIVMIVILLFVAKGVWDVRAKSKLGEQRRVHAEKTLEELTIKQQESQASLDRIKSKLGQEEELRHKYNVVKEGENIVVIVDPEEEQEVEMVPEKKGFWAKLKFWKD